MKTKLHGVVKAAVTIIPLQKCGPKCAPFPNTGLVARLLLATLADVDARIAVLKKRRAEMADLLKQVCPITTKL